MEYWSSEYTSPWVSLWKTGLPLVLNAGSISIPSSCSRVGYRSRRIRNSAVFPVPLSPATMSARSSMMSRNVSVSTKYLARAHRTRQRSSLDLAGAALAARASLVSLVVAGRRLGGGVPLWGAACAVRLDGRSRVRRLASMRPTRAPGARPPCWHPLDQRGPQRKT